MSIKKSQQLKQLQSRKAKLEVDIKSLKQEATEKQQAHSKAMNQLQAINREIESLQTTEIVVSEHAIIRYMERAMGLDIEQIKNQILTQENVTLIENMGNGKYPICEGLSAIVRDNTVVSVA